MYIIPNPDILAPTPTPAKKLSHGATMTSIPYSSITLSTPSVAAHRLQIARFLEVSVALVDTEALIRVCWLGKNTRKQLLVMRGKGECSAYRTLFPSLTS